MKIIKKLSGMIEEEIADADKYVVKALELKDTNRKLADLFYTLSTEEMKHMSQLHGEVVKIIDEYRRNNGDPPEGMMMLYDFLHQKHIEEAGRVKVLQAMYLE